VAYEIATGQHRDILPEQHHVAGAASVHRGEDGKIYGQAGAQNFRLEGWAAIPIPATEVRGETTNRLADGRLVAQAADGIVRVVDPKTKQETRHPFGYAGKEIDLFRLGMGPDGMLYGSSVLPIHFVRIDPQSGALNELGELGGGEFYSFLRHGPHLLGAAYSGRAPLMQYDPAKPYHPGKDAGHNPLLVDYAGSAGGWRPQAMIAGPGGKIYLGAVATYGMLGGPLTVWDPATNQVESFPHVVKDQSVVSLTTAGGLIIGGTTISGGGGSHPTEKEAKLFVWDPGARQKLFETVPVPAASQITNLITAPNGRVYGIAGDKTLFVFEPKTRRVTHTAALPFTIPGNAYNSVAIGPDGRIWGLASSGIFAIDPKTRRAELVATAPEPVTAGFALEGRSIYYISGPGVYRYTLPER
jgi:hypothetical protein